MRQGLGGARAQRRVEDEALEGRKQAVAAEQPDEPSYAGRGEPMLSPADFQQRDVG